MLRLPQHPAPQSPSTHPDPFPHVVGLTPRGIYVYDSDPVFVSSLNNLLGSNSMCPALL